MTHYQKSLSKNYSQNFSGYCEKAYANYLRFLKKRNKMVDLFEYGYYGYCPGNYRIAAQLHSINHRANFLLSSFY